jgi:hypothetical protein
MRTASRHGSVGSDAGGAVVAGPGVDADAPDRKRAASAGDGQAGEGAAARPCPKPAASISARRRRRTASLASHSSPDECEGAGAASAAKDRQVWVACDLPAKWGSRPSRRRPRRSARIICLCVCVCVCLVLPRRTSSPSRQHFAKTWPRPLGVLRGVGKKKKNSGPLCPPHRRRTPIPLRVCTRGPSLTRTREGGTGREAEQRRRPSLFWACRRRRGGGLRTLSA